MIGIYIITNNLDRSSYIGKSYDIDFRLGQHKRGLKSNVHLQRAINKYGIENFKFDILEECSKSNLNEREIFWINKKLEDGCKLYNIALGGHGGDTISRLDKESYDRYIKKLSKPRSEKFRIEQSIRFRGKRNGMCGKKISKETRELLISQRTGRIWINDGSKMKFIKKEDYDTFNKSIWVRGMISKRKSATTIERIANEKYISE